MYILRVRMLSVRKAALFIGIANGVLQMLALACFPDAALMMTGFVS